MPLHVTQKGGRTSEIKEGWLYKLRETFFLHLKSDWRKNRSRIRQSVVRIRGSRSYRNVTDPQHCRKANFRPESRLFSWKVTFSASIFPTRNQAQDSCDSGICIQTLYTVPKSNLCIPIDETAWPRSQFLHSGICKPFLYSQDRSAYLAAS